jgi:hypothetical protein
MSGVKEWEYECKDGGTKVQFRLARTIEGRLALLVYCAIPGPLGRDVGFEYLATVQGKPLNTLAKRILGKG